MVSIPTQKADITDPWVFLLVNQYLLKHGKSPLKSTLMKDMKFEVQDCKHCVGDFSLTYALNVSVPNGKCGVFLKTNFKNIYLPILIQFTEPNNKETDIFFSP